jgi:4-diphosphocytidyl-2-C-methyl-D-erythritol kinase
MSALRALAPAKINLGLCLGPVRAEDGRHELASVMQSISLADEVTLEAGDAADEVLCPGVRGQNLAAHALRAFRAATGWEEGPLRVRIHKRIPVAAGLGGGSADAAATLRLLRRASGRGDDELLGELARELGADVPAQIAPGRWLAWGAGERLEALPDPRPGLAVLVLPLARELSTAAVYAEADRLGLTRPPELLARRRRELRGALAGGAPLPRARELLANDLQPAAVSLCAEIEHVLEQARDAGAEQALVSGSGPTVVALFSSARGAEQAAAAAAALASRDPAPACASSVGAAYGRPQPLGRRAERPGDVPVRHNPREDG